MDFGFMDVILLLSSHQHVLATRGHFQGGKIKNEQFTVQTVSSLTNLDHNSPFISSVYIIPQHHTSNNTF
jgi:hypothetical protein